MRHLHLSCPKPPVALWSDTLEMGEVIYIYDSTVI